MIQFRKYGNTLWFRRERFTSLFVTLDQKNVLPVCTAQPARAELVANLMLLKLNIKTSGKATKQKCSCMAVYVDLIHRGTRIPNTLRVRTAFWYFSGNLHYFKSLKTELMMWSSCLHWRNDKRLPIIALNMKKNPENPSFLQVFTSVMVWVWAPKSTHIHQMLSVCHSNRTL